MTVIFLSFILLVLFVFMSIFSVFFFFARLRVCLEAVHLRLGAFGGVDASKKQHEKNGCSQDSFSLLFLLFL